MPLVPIRPVSGANRCIDAAPALRTAGRPAEELGEQLAGRNALGQRMPVPAMGAEDHVVGSQVATHARRDGLLSDVCVAGPVDQTLLVRPGQVAPRTAGSGPSSDKGSRILLW